VGGGGKTTLAFRIAQQASAASHRTVVTTTTRMLMPTEANGLDAVILEDALSSAQQRLRDAFAAGAQRVLLAAGSESSVEGEWVVGIPIDWVPELRGDGLADVVVVEADGSRKLPFKTPQVPHEPALPVGVEVVAAVMGIDCLGVPLLEEHVCCADDMAAVAGVETGCLVTPDIVGRVLGDRSVWCHDAALEAAQVADDLPQFYAVVNKVDTKEAWDQAGDVLAALFQQGQGLGGILVTGDAGCGNGRGAVLEAQQLPPIGGGKDGHINEEVVALALSNDSGFQGCACRTMRVKHALVEGFGSDEGELLSCLQMKDQGM